jgi:tricorn protease
MKIPALGLATLSLLFSVAPSAQAQVDARLLRYPDVSATSITFVYGGDIWVVPREGGVAQRLSSPAGEETFPRFSPDGARIAFSGNYDGNTDVYVMPAAGGSPVRLTHHPSSDRLIDWYPDGRALLIASGMQSEKDRFNKLYRLASSGGLPEQLPLPYGEVGAISPDGRQIAYTPGSLDFRTWKRYRGGWAQDLWLFDLASHAARKITDTPADETSPMWHGNTLYFLSDRGANQRHNLWAYDASTGQSRQITTFSDFDVHFPAIGPSDIVFEQGGQLWLLPLAGGAPHAVRVQVITDRASLRPKVVKVEKLIQDAAVSPTGKRVAFEARGEVFSLPAEHGVTLDLTHASGSAERYPTYSPDGRSIAYWSDRSGEYELTVAPADGKAEPRTVSHLGAGFRFRPYWSPDSKSIAFIDQAMKIHLMDVASGRDRVIDSANTYFQDALDAWTPSWSPDSRWLAYQRDLPSAQDAIFLFDTRAGTPHQVTSGFYGASRPTFDRDGKYLFFLTDRSFEPAYSAVDNSWIYPNTTVLAAVPLRLSTPSPLAPRNDVEGADTDSASTDSTKTGKGSKASPAPAPTPVAIDLDDFERRIVVLPPEAGNYGPIAAVAGKILYIRRPRTGSVEDSKSALVYYDLKEREEKTVLADISDFRLSADGKHVLARVRDKFALIEVKPDQKADKPLPTASLEAVVDPRAEWKQIFNDVWRFQRDMFYDPGMHGVDWNAMRQRYGALVDQAVSREDLNFALENGAFRIRRIVDGAPWDSEVRSPLRQPGVNVKEGDYILAVDGRPLDPTSDPWAAFDGLAEKTVSLTVNDRPTREGARTVLVETLAQEGRLRNLAWIDANRRKVLDATGGKVGYIYVPDTGLGGQTELVRQFLGQRQMDGLIIDERFNSGGQIPDRFIELLNRPITNFWGVRDGHDWQWPPFAHTGPKVMLINEWSGSGGDAFPYYFRQAGLGPLIGKRTWGGLIGISGAPTLVDGGSITVPDFGIYSTDGKWIIENHGVDPDIEVEQDPSKMANGGDPQLERAIQEVLARMKTDPPVRPKKPAYPRRVPTATGQD